MKYYFLGFKVMSVFKQFAYLWVAVVLVLCASCGAHVDGTSSVSSAAPSSAVQSSSKAPVSSAPAEEQTPKYTIQNKFYKSDVWQSVPLTAAGEGGLTVNDLAFAPDGKSVFAATDIGGIYRSANAGESWQPCNVGFLATGAAALAVDPNNGKRLLAVGVGFADSDKNGLYLSTNGGDGWQCVLKVNADGHQSVIYSPATYDKGKKYTAVVYFICGSGIYRTQDGGENWEKINDTLGGCYGAALYGKDTLICGNGDGLFSITGGKEVKMLLSRPIYSVAVSAANKKALYVLTDAGVELSQDGGKTFTAVAKKFTLKNLGGLTVSDADAAVMLLQSGSTAYYSQDGGKTFSASLKDATGGFIPHRARGGVFALSPKDKAVALTVGGDYLMRSQDGGKRFTVWGSPSGNNSAGHLSFNADNGDMIYAASRDYNGAYTVDGGKTWKYISWYKQSGGCTYGGYVVDKNTVITCLRDSDGRYQGGDSCYIATTFDGGKTVNVMVDYTIESPESISIMGLKGDKKRIFAGQWLSQDGGKSFSMMNGCTGVFYYDSKGGRLYGKNKNTVVVSKDKGATWAAVATADREIMDIAYNAEKQTLFVVTAGGLFRLEKGADSFEKVDIGLSGVRSVCVDEKQGYAVYIGCSSGSSKSEQSVLRSQDDGLSWTVLTRTAGDKRSGPDGGREALSVRVNPKSGALWVATAGHGLWTLPKMSKK